MTDAKTVKLRLIEHGELDIEVPAADYEGAVRDGALQSLLDPHLPLIPSEWTVVDEDHIARQPYSLNEQVRPSLLGPGPTEAIAAIIAQVRPVDECRDCETYSWPSRGLRPCARHVAEALVEMVRSEDLIILPTEVADRIVRMMLSPDEIAAKVAEATRPE